jgi:hypothetical protein
LSPWEALYHSRLGLALEETGNVAEAERELVEGAKLSRKYEPRWDLLNFYFRRGRWEPFWQTASEALQMSWGDRSALFELANQAEGGRARLEAVLPARREVRINYAAFLLTKGSTKEAAPFVVEAARSSTPDEVAMFRGWSELLVQARLIGDALKVWDAAKIPGEPFPWKANDASGISALEVDRRWQIHLNGEEPEHTMLLESVKPVRAGVRYRLDPRMEDRLTPSGGLLWRIETIEQTPRALEQSFVAPEGVEAVRLRLEYQRPQGSVRGEGEIRLQPTLEADAK